MNPKDIFSTFFNTVSNVSSFQLIDAESLTSLPGHETYYDASIFFNDDSSSYSNPTLQQYLSVSYFLDYYANNTVSVLNTDSENIVGYSNGLFFNPLAGASPQKKDFLDDDMMEALRDMVVTYEVSFTLREDAPPLFIVGYVWSFALNFVVVSQPWDEAARGGLILGYNIDYNWATGSGSTFADFCLFWQTQCETERQSLPAGMFVYYFLQSENYTLAGFEEVFTQHYSLAPLAAAEPCSNASAAVRSNCSNLRDSSCYNDFLPSYFFVVAETVPTQPLIFSTKYGLAVNKSCQYLPKVSMNGMPKSYSRDDLIEVDFLVQDGNDFLALECVPGADGGSLVWDESSLCNTTRSELYGLYESDWYSSPADFLSSLKQHNYNIENMYSAMRVWPTRHNNTVYVISAAGDDVSADIPIACYQECTNVYQDFRGEEVSGCADDIPLWNWAVFFFSIIIIVVIMFFWIWGALYARQFERRTPDYYRQLECYEEVLRRINFRESRKSDPGL